MFYHWTNLPLNGQPPYSPLPEESVRLLKEQLERLKKFLAEMEKVRKEELKWVELKDFSILHEIKLHPEPMWLESIRFEPKLLKKIQEDQFVDTKTSNGLYKSSRFYNKDFKISK
jgi:hypothetical protein